MEKVIIYGTTIFSYMIYRYIKEEKGAEVVAFAVDEKYMDTANWMSDKIDIPVIVYEKLESNFDKNSVYILNTVGYKSMCEKRALVDEKLLNNGYKLFTYISKKAYVYTNDIGEGSIIMPCAFLSCDVKIGKSNIIYSNVNISHECQTGGYCYFSTGATISGNCKIGNNCFFGVNSCVKDNTEISNYTLVGAGVYINKKTREYGVYSPAKAIFIDKIKSIDII